MVKQSKKFFVLRFIQLFISFIWIFPISRAVGNYFNWTELFNFLFLVYCLVEVTSIFFQYFATKYVFETNSLKVEYGKYIIKTLILENGRNFPISNIRVSHSLIQKVLGINGLTVYLSNGDDTGNIVFGALSEKQLTELLDFLNSTTENVAATQSDTKNNLVNESVLDSKTLFLTGLYSSKYFLAIPFLLDVHDWSSHIIFIDNLWKNKIAIVIISSVIIFSWTFVNQYLSFSKFKLYDYNDKFIVYNGLLDSDRNMMQKSNIIGLEITETVGQKFLNLMSISVLLVNSDQGRSLAGNQLLPYIPKSKSDYLIDKYLNEFIYSYRLVSNGTNQLLKKNKPFIKFFYFMYLLILCGLIIAILNIFFPLIAHLFLFSVVVVLLLPILMHRFFTNYAKKEAMLIFKEGVITRKITFLPEYFVAAKMTFSIGKYNVKRIIYSDTKPAKKYIIIG